jgi:hypothetical protein
MPSAKKIARTRGVSFLRFQFQFSWGAENVTAAAADVP